MRFAAGGFLEFPHHSIQVEGCRFLARREFGEGFDLLGDRVLHIVDDVSVRDHPIPIRIRVFIGALERILAS